MKTFTKSLFVYIALCGFSTAGLPLYAGGHFVMNYQKIYDQLIYSAKSEVRKKGNGIYYEDHHIIPRCLEGSNEKENRVLLTAREHFVAHKILFKIYPNNKKIALAYHSLTYTMNGERKLKLSSRDFQAAREAASLASSGKNNPRYGVVRSAESLLKSSIALKGKVSWMKGKKMSEESKMKLRASLKGNGLGVPKSLEMRRKTSEWQRGRKKPYKEQMIKRKPISAISPDGVFMVFSGAVEMKQRFGLNTTCILECLNGEQKTTRKWHTFNYLPQT